MHHISIERFQALPGEVSELIYSHTIGEDKIFKAVKLEYADCPFFKGETLTLKCYIYVTQEGGILEDQEGHHEYTLLRD